MNGGNMNEKAGVTEIRLRLVNYIASLSKIGLLLEEAAQFQKPPGDDFPMAGNTPNDVLLFDDTMREALMRARLLENDMKTLREVIGMVTFEDK